MTVPTTIDKPTSAIHTDAEYRAAVLATRAVTRRALVRDILTVSVVLVVSFVMAERFNLFERLVGLVRPYEDGQLDEALVTLAILPFALVAILAVRWREVRRALLRSAISERATINAMAAAQAANRAKSEFLANMSHEIRTPMNGIVGMTELALGTDLTPEQRSYLETVRTSADALLTLINDILDFSKIEARKLDIERIDFNLALALDETMRLLAPQAHEEGLELAVPHRP